MPSPSVLGGYRVYLPHSIGGTVRSLVLLLSVLSVIRPVSAGAQEPKDARDLTRVGWAETRQAIAKLFPVLERIAQIKVIVVVDAAVDSLGNVAEGAVVAPSGFLPIDSVAPDAARAFRFARPIEAGLYRIRVPFVVDSLIPVAMTDRCFPDAALTALAMGVLERYAEEGWGLSFVTTGSRCVDVVNGWASSESAIDLLASISGMPCAPARCPGSVDESRHITVTISRVEMTWPETQWTFYVHGAGPRPRWIVDCFDATRCMVTGYSLTIS
jgi:hypothetical protein